jgi:hypothetical protein
MVAGVAVAAGHVTIVLVIIDPEMETTVFLHLFLWHVGPFARITFPVEQILRGVEF